jgi:nicotinamidase/pyrazinamidase
MTKKKAPVKKIILGVFGIIILFILVLFVNLVIVGKYESIISKGQPISNYTETRHALLIIDIQEATTGNLSMYPYFKEKSEVFIRNINQMVDSFKILNLPVIYVRSEITNPLINFLNNSYAKGSPGAKNDRRLKIVSNLEIVKKGKDSFRNTNLDSILISNKINELSLVGLDAAECVNATAEAAQNRKYKVNLIEEAVLSKSKESTDSMMVCFKNRGVRVIQINKLEKIN